MKLDPLVGVFLAFIPGVLAYQSDTSHRVGERNATRVILSRQVCTKSDAQTAKEYALSGRGSLPAV
jgi:hypothetical protein